MPTASNVVEAVVSRKRSDALGDMTGSKGVQGDFYSSWKRT